MKPSNLQLIMTSASIFLGALGILFSFLPEEIIIFQNAPAGNFNIMIAQFYGASCLALGITNWMVRKNKIGGIYNRPLALGNILFFAVPAITMIKSILSTGHTSTLFIIIAFLFGFFAIAFLKITFTHPKN